MQTIESTKSSRIQDQTNCYHCGEQCSNDQIQIEDKHFCCEGCKTVYEILNENDLCQYYNIDENAGVSLKGQKSLEYAFLEEVNVQERLIDFTDGDLTKVTFYLPQIHCASCIWLLENLYKLSDGISSSKVNFLKKEIYITYKESITNLRKVVEVLASIGYAPSINFNDLEQNEKPVIERKFFYKLGVAGFAFGNIMLLSFPEYLGLNELNGAEFFTLFGYLNILLATPLVFYSGAGYIKSAWWGLKQRNLNIDMPIAIGVLTLYGRSVYEIVSGTGAGYLDSLAGLILFLLIGKWFQQRTYHHISFERDYKSYFPIAATLKRKDLSTTTISLDQLNPGDTILVGHKELIPADGILIRGQAEIDYSFVTGESAAVFPEEGEKIYAGGRQMGETVEISLTKRVSQSYLTELWNDEAFTKTKDSETVKLADRVGKVFTFVILLIAGITLAYWLPRDIGTAVNAFTAVLIIACPCAVALAIPFIFGNAIRIFGRHQFYLKNTSVIERIITTNRFVFDKTGTLTNREKGNIEFLGTPLSSTEKQILQTLTKHSSHPLSRRINHFVSEDLKDQSYIDPCLTKVKEWEEIVGKGIQGIICQKFIKLGSKSFMDTFLHDKCDEAGNVFLQINSEIRGSFKMDNLFREGAYEVLNYFKNRGDIFLLSGDNDKTKSILAPIFDDKSHLMYRQSPKDKLAFIKQQQDAGYQIGMLGDGLNDAGALQQSDLGIVVAENTNNFTPACDAIIAAEEFKNLPTFVDFAKGSLRLVYWAYAFALVYNIIGLSYAVQGELSPIVAAILMPLSSISIVAFGTLSSNILARKKGL